MGNRKTLVDPDSGLEYVTDGTYGPSRFVRWWRCDLCGQSFSRDKIKKFRGKIYGVPCGDYKDIPGIIRNEKANKFRRERYDEEDR